MSAPRPQDVRRTSERQIGDVRTQRETETETETSKNTSSRSMALRDQPNPKALDRWLALAQIVESLRPDWTRGEIVGAIGADDRPWRTVVAASIRGALLDGADTIRHPNGLRYVNPTAGTGVPQLPTVDEALNPPLCPDHGSALPCPLCRRTA